MQLTQLLLTHQQAAGAFVCEIHGSENGVCNLYRPAGWPQGNCSQNLWRFSSGSGHCISNGTELDPKTFACSLKRTLAIEIRKINYFLIVKGKISRVSVCLALGCPTPCQTGFEWANDAYWQLAEWHHRRHCTLNRRRCCSLHILQSVTSYQRYSNNVDILKFNIYSLRLEI